MKHELVRKAVHAFLAVLIALIGLHAPQWVVYVVAGALFVAFALARSWHHTRVFHAVPRVSYGEFYFILGILCSAAWFLPDHTTAWIAGMLVLAFADPLAALVGRRLGTHTYRIIGEMRSVEGSAACCAAVVCVFYAVGATPLYALFAGLFLAVVEASALRGSDNALLPIVAGALVVLGI